MPSIGPLELAIVLAIVLLVVGARRWPELGRQLGTGIREFWGGIKGGRDEPAPPPELPGPGPGTEKPDEGDLSERDRD